MSKKRNSGNGSVHKLPSGSWRGQIMDGYLENGKRNVISFTGRTKGEVQDLIREYWSKKERSRYLYTGQMSFQEWADNWLADYETEVEASTFSGYKYTLKILKDWFKDTPVSQIKALEINKFLDVLQKNNMSKSYIRKCRAMLIQIFDYAEANELVLFNPARKTKKMRVKGKEKLGEMSAEKKDAFNDKELEIIENCLPDNIVGHSILILLSTGLRTQELLALQPSDIAEDGSTISVSKAIKMVDGNPTLGPPKSERGKRIVPVPVDYRHNAVYLRIHSGRPYVWTSKRESGLYDIGAFRRRYYNVMKQIPGIRKLSPHCCRHTYISNLEKHGVPMELIARLAGHSNLTTTDGYLHADLNTLSSAVSVLNTENS